jgi:WD40 repeat protein
LKASPQHDRIALTNSDDKTVDVFDFDNATGILSNRLTHPIDRITYGAEFSPNGPQLYATGYTTTANQTPRLYQYTITSTGISHVGNVQYWDYIGSDGNLRGGGLKLGYVFAG